MITVMTSSRTRPGDSRATCSTSSRCCGTRWCSHCRSSRCARTTVPGCASSAAPGSRTTPTTRTRRRSTRGGQALQQIQNERHVSEGSTHAGRPGRPEVVGENSGSPEAEDVAEQHASPSLAVEGRRAVPRDLCQPGVRCPAPAAPRVRHVRPVRRPVRPSPGPVTLHRSADQLRGAPVRHLGDPVLDPELLERALTHRSYAYENGGLPTNERLEFLGDSVLGVVVTETLYLLPPRPLRGAAGQAPRRGRQRPRARRGRQAHRRRRPRQARPRRGDHRGPRQGLDPLRHRRGGDRRGPPQRRLRRLRPGRAPALRPADGRGRQARRRPRLEDLAPGALRRARARACPTTSSRPRAPTT